MKKNYRKKPIGAARLSANDIMTRQKLKAYQDGYALAMAKYGLKRGIVGSEARHTTTAQYYRDLLNQTEDIQENIGLLLAEKERAESELAKIKSEARTEQLKNKATDAMTAIASGVGSLFGSGKLKELEQANGKLQGEIDKRDNQIRLQEDAGRASQHRDTLPAGGTPTGAEHEGEENRRAERNHRQSFQMVPHYKRNAANGEVLQVGWIHAGNDRRTFG